MKRFFVVAALVLAACSTPAPAPVAALPADDNRPCAVISKDYQQVVADLAALEPEAKKAEAKNKELRQSLMSKILLFQYLEYDAEVVGRFEALKKRKNDLELVMAARSCAV